MTDDLRTDKDEKIRLWLIDTISNNDNIVWNEDINKDEVLEWLSRQRIYEPYTIKVDENIINGLKQMPTEFSALVDKHLFELV